MSFEWQYVPNSSIKFISFSSKSAYNHYRSGATKQELKGVSLQNWLLKKVGKHWEDLPAASARLADLDEDSIRNFLKKAISQNAFLQKQRSTISLHYQEICTFSTKKVNLSMPWSCF